MTEEQKTASTEQASITEPVSPVVKPTAPAVEITAPIPQPLTEERLLQLLTERDAKMTSYLQSRADIRAKRLEMELDETRKKADLIERGAKAYETGFSDLDEDTRSKLEARKLRSENEYLKSQQQEEESRRQQEVYFEKLNQSLKDEVTSMGIDPSDSRVDYAADAKDYFDGRKRFTDSLAKIVKSEKDALEKTVIQKVDERVKHFEAELRKKYNLDSQDTTTSVGVVNESDADFMAKWGAYELPDSKVNRDRYDQIKKKYY